MATTRTPWPVPPTHAGEWVRLVPLTADLVDLDLAAYRSSPRAIAAHAHGEWPPDLTREQDLEMIAAHEREHAAGEAFAYAALAAEADRQIGSVYLRPLAAHLDRAGATVERAEDAGAFLTFWLIDDNSARPGATPVLRELLGWLADWPGPEALLRALPEEVTTTAAARALHLEELHAADQELPYRWFTTVPQA
ncbi:hypothetical protein [Nocardioides insulae]|uniref:hypothetical protein n=1 Tax=Nocardioides insulae TaxID=394734 RepID=UPI0004230EF7|nr:hypothetical protein [Nocardioides insulae]